MPLIETSFVIASRRPDDLAEFYAKVHKTEFSKGINSDHYLVPISNGLNIQIYRTSNSQDFPKNGRSACLCFQKRASAEPLLIVQEWSIEIQRFGGTIQEEPREKSFGVEAWHADPEGNEFLIFVPSHL